MLHKKYSFLIIMCIFIILSLLLLSGCGNFTQPQVKNSFTLNTVISVTFYDTKDASAVDGALEICRNYEKVFSRTMEGSELCELNISRSADVSDELLFVISTALSYCEKSGGRFDITMGGVSSLYDFTETSPSHPDIETLANAVSKVGYKQIGIDGNRVTIAGDAMIDLGAIAKGYIADRMRDYLIENGVEHAIISLGGNVLTIGGRPDGSRYEIGIQRPEKHSDEIAETVFGTDMSVVTSGIYERSFVDDGTVYHHILDSTSGLPVMNGIASVSIVGPSSIDCDALSTVCFVMGVDDGIELIEKTDGYEAVFIMTDGEMIYSSGFQTLTE